MVKRDGPAEGCVLVFSIPKSYTTHLGIFTGEGTFVHARERTGIREAPFIRPWDDEFLVGCYDFPGV